MNKPDMLGNTARGLQCGIIAQLRGWWTGKDADADYLAAATDPADLERRLRLLDRGSGGPVFETFNH